MFEHSPQRPYRAEEFYRDLALTQESQRISKAMAATQMGVIGQEIKHMNRLARKIRQLNPETQSEDLYKASVDFIKLLNK